MSFYESLQNWIFEAWTGGWGQALDCRTLIMLSTPRTGGLRQPVGPPARPVRVSAEYLLDLERCATTIIGSLHGIAFARHDTGHGIQHVYISVRYIYSYVGSVEFRFSTASRALFMKLLFMPRAVSRLGTINSHSKGWRG